MSQPTIDECLVWIGKAIGHTEDSAWIAGSDLANSRMLRAIRAILEQQGVASLQQTSLKAGDCDAVMREAHSAGRPLKLEAIRAFVERVEKRAVESAERQDISVASLLPWAIGAELAAMEKGEGAE